MFLKKGELKLKKNENQNVHLIAQNSDILQVLITVTKT